VQEATPLFQQVHLDSERKINGKRKTSGGAGRSKREDCAWRGEGGRGRHSLEACATLSRIRGKVPPGRVNQMNAHRSCTLASRAPTTRKTACEQKSAPLQSKRAAFEKENKKGSGGKLNNVW